MATGTYQNSIDTKYRMIVPAKFRQELEYKCVIGKGFDKCLYLYTMDGWEEFSNELKEKLPRSDSKARKLSRHFTGSATECELDKQGRIIIPQELREYANINKELVTVGTTEGIEVWSKEEYDKDGKFTDATVSELGDELIEYGI